MSLDPSPQKKGAMRTLIDGRTGEFHYEINRGEGNPYWVISAIKKGETKPPSSLMMVVEDEATKKKHPLDMENYRNLV